MTHRTLDMGRAWTQATALVSANRELVSVLAGLFLFLPLFVLLLALAASDLDFGTAGSAPDPERIAAQIRAVLQTNWWALLLTVIGQLCGGIAILALLGDRTRPTVGEVLRRVPRLLLPMLGTQLLIGLITQGPSLVLGALPDAIAALGNLIAFPVTIYLSVKFCLASAVIVIGERLNPVAAMRESWRLTSGNSLRLFAFFLALSLLGMVIALIIVLVAGLVLAAAGAHIATIGNGAIFALLLTVYYTLSFALSAALYHQLSQPVPADYADPFE